MSLNDLLNEVMRLKEVGRKSYLLSDKEENDRYSIKSSSKKPPYVSRPLAAYGLGNEYGSVYLTRREAECMVLLLKGKTINGVASVLKLSPRTVEYYIKNMKSKLGCRTKFELVDLVYASEFMKNVDF
jgi:DNA-binding CsgD family transcriptional regulator